MYFYDFSYILLVLPIYDEYLINLCLIFYVFDVYCKIFCELMFADTFLNLANSLKFYFAVYYYFIFYFKLTLLLFERTELFKFPLLRDYFNIYGLTFYNL